MNSHEIPNEKTCLETMKDIIKRSPDAIAKEFETVKDNTWIECFKNRNVLNYKTAPV